MHRLDSLEVVGRIPLYTAEISFPRIGIRVLAFSPETGIAVIRADSEITDYSNVPRRELRLRPVSGRRNYYGSRSSLRFRDFLEGRMRKQRLIHRMSTRAAANRFAERFSVNDVRADGTGDGRIHAGPKGKILSKIGFRLSNELLRVRETRIRLELRKKREELLLEAREFC